ncbi:hypothetical protein OG413_39555 [Streptomyces sp. NBC_01433]|uniref:hypothetical protein n=1 Tax=Streptomyces sp. NBC_01433 TaxID=2903864 RepID=UPI002255F4BA|nr:hypothetical protein [Streptomyces sp. NBC_01433]MCX4681295.1 hypothetical protein [Streptomyces sp. NBC_01433]
MVRRKPSLLSRDKQERTLCRRTHSSGQVPFPAQSASATPRARTRRSFHQTAELLRLFVERRGRPPRAREWMEADGERVMIGPWLCKVRTRRNLHQLSEEKSQLMREILKDDWITADHEPSTEEPGQVPEIP